MLIKWLLRGGIVATFFFLLTIGSVQVARAGETTDLLFSENFDSLSSAALAGQNNWHTLTTWTVTATTSGKNLVGGNSVFNTSVATQQLATSTDTRVKVDFLASANNGIQVWLRRSSIQSTAVGYNFYRIDDGKFYLAYLDGGTVTGLADVAVGLTSGSWYTVEFEAVNNTSGNPVLSAWVYPQGEARPGTPTLTFTDTGKRIIGAGLSGIGGYNADVTVDNFQVYTGDSEPSDLLFSDNFDSLTSAAIAGQNNWHTLTTWTVTATTSGKNLVGGNSNYNTSVATQKAATSTNTRVKVDFLASSVAGVQVWLRRSSVLSTASGYDFYRFNDGKFYLAHINGVTVNALANAAMTLVSGAWYTVEFQAVNDAAGNPILTAWVYPQGGSRPLAPVLSYTDTDKRAAGAGLPGIGGFNTNVTVDNFQVYTGDNGPDTAPSAPTSLGSVASTTQITLSWTAPSDGGSPITDYFAEYRTGSDAYAVFPDGISTNTNLTVTGLATSTPYDFRVYAVNAVGTSTAASISMNTTSGFFTPTPTLLMSTTTAGVGTVTSGAIDTTGATLLTLTLSVYNTSAAGVTVTDSQGNTWRALNNRAGTANIHTTIWYAYDKSGGSLVTSQNHTVTITRAGTFNPGGVFSAWSGTIISGDPFDVQANNGGNGSSLGTNSITPTRNNALILSTFGSDTAGTYSPGSLTLLTSLPYVLAYNMGNAQAYSFQRQAAATSTTWTNSNSGNFATVIAAFKSYSTDISTTSPSAPTNPTTTSGAALINLSWQRPASDGGSPVTDYVIQYRKGSDAFTTFNDGVSLTTSATITNLVPGSLYNFRIYAINAFGTSSALSFNAQTAARSINITSPARAVSASSTVATISIDRVECSTSFSIPYIQTSTTFSPAVSVEDAAMPVGGGVRFVLTDTNGISRTLYDMSAPYTVSFTSLPKGTYTLVTSIVDASQQVPVGSQFQDTATSIGIGDIFVAIGDSITEGYDGTAWNVAPYTNWLNVPARSADSRNYPQCGISSGYYQDHWQELSHHIQINDKLSQHYGYPVFILNEGSAGITSGGYVTRTGLSSWQNRMTTLAPNKWLLHLGVNDLGGSPTFQTNMQSLIDTLKNTYGAQGRDIVLAIPTIRTNWQPYIQNLVAANDLTQGPNFNAFYANNTSPTLYVGVHPNAAGHVQMGRLWGISILSPKNVSVNQVGGSVNISWDSLSGVESTISGYRLYYGTSTQALSTSVDLGNVTSTSVSSGLVSGQTYYFALRGYDNDAYLLNYTATSTPVSLAYVVDNDAPVFSGLATSSTNSTITLSWVTNELASSRVAYGLVNSLSQTTSETDTSPRVLNHEVTITGLRPCTRYALAAVSRDGVLNTATSSSVFARTTGCTGDAQISQTGSQSVDTSAGGSVTQDRIVLNVPESFTASSSAAVFQIHSIDAGSFALSAGGPTGKTRAGNKVFNLSALIDETTEISTFLEPLTIQFSYDDADVVGVNESTLKIYRYSSGTWSPLTNCVVNTNANTVTCETQAFSDFGIYGDAVVSVSSPSPSVQSVSANGPIVGSTFGLAFGTTPVATKPATNPEATKAAKDASSAMSFSRDLRLGQSHEEVRLLQKFLNDQGFIIAKNGAGSPGKETTFFGSLTRSALIRFQERHADKILRPAGLVRGTGFFGPSTRRFIHTLSSTSL
jgi:lysophospholipase L1-like esterase